MSDSPYIPFYPSDWLAGTRGLTAAETGIYITLIAMMYEREAPLDMPETRLARLCGCPLSRFRLAMETLVSERKIIPTEAGLWNDRVQRECDVRSQKRNMASQSASTRWAKKDSENNASADAVASSAQCERNANQSHSQKKRETNVSLPWFDEFWSVCPRKAGKGQARRAYAAALKKADAKTLIAAMRAYGETRKGQDEQFTAHPATWLNGERWADAAPQSAGREPKIGDRRRLPTGRLVEWNGGLEGWITIHEDDDGDSMGNPAGSGDQRSGRDWDAADDLPRMQQRAEEQGGSLPLGDIQARRGGVEMLALRVVGGPVL